MWYDDAEVEQEMEKINNEEKDSYAKYQATFQAKKEEEKEEDLDNNDNDNEE